MPTEELPPRRKQAALVPNAQLREEPEDYRAGTTRVMGARKNITRMKMMTPAVSATMLAGTSESAPGAWAALSLGKSRASTANFKFPFEKYNVQLVVSLSFFVCSDSPAIFFSNGVFAGWLVSL
jgi:hypothetical protein